MKEIDWNKLRDDAHANSLEHGWWEGTPSDKHFLCLVISELMEAVEADRNNIRADVEQYMNRIEHSRICQGLDDEIPKEKGYEVSFERHIKDTVEDELADAAIRILDLAGAHNINLNGRFCIQNVVTKRKSFTENIYAIVKDLVNYKYTLEEQLNYCLMQIEAFSEFLNINLVKHIELKMMYNKTRAYKHGKKY